MTGDLSYIYIYYHIYISYILSISISISICQKDLEIFDAAEWRFSKGNRDLNAAFLGIWTSIFISMEDWFFIISKHGIHHDLSISHKSVSPKTWDTPRMPVSRNMFIFKMGKIMGKQCSRAWNVGIPCFQTEPCSQQQRSFAHLTPIVDG